MLQKPERSPAIAQPRWHHSEHPHFECPKFLANHHKVEKWKARLGIQEVVEGFDVFRLHFVGGHVQVNIAETGSFGLFGLGGRSLRIAAILTQPIEGRSTA